MADKLVLASASPRRRILLSQVGFIFEVASAELDESIRKNEDAVLLVERLAAEKAGAVAYEHGNSVIIGADTVVVKDVVMGKPVHVSEAFNMLKSLQGGWHQVITGFCIMKTGYPEMTRIGHEITKVRIRNMSDDEIRWYIHTNEPMDKAGSYAIQGKGSMFVDRIEGCYFNVVGLPVARLVMELQLFGIYPV